MRGKVLLAAPLLLLLGSDAGRAEVTASKHDLSVSGTGSIVAVSETQVCIFCHTPHNANPAVPLWNHQLSSVGSYSTYSSTTLTLPTPLQQPTGSSKLCLSCHDGTVALGQTVNDGLIALQNTGAGGRMPAGASNLGTDLADDHPISFQPNPANSETLDPPSGDPVSLDSAGEVQCTSCHDPHTEDNDAVTRRFLVKSNQASAICLTCHQPDFWSTNPTSHQSSTAAYLPAQGAHTGYTTVADNACESCHRPHSGNEPQRLLKFVEEATCDSCHDGSVASKDVSADFLKPFAHPTFSTTPSVHDASESPSDPTATLPEINPGAARHAECQDCHNPHAAVGQSAAAPDASGRLSGTWGIDSDGARRDPALAEYEICYKCHADSANKPQEAGLPFPPYTQRQIVQFNTRLEFDPLNPSHHGVEAPGANPDVPSLLAPYTTASVIYCTDCHSSDTGPGAGGGGADGPHGSIYNHLLERNLNVGDGNSGTDFSNMYALCFKCHSEASILGDQSFPHHKRHIDRENSSCMVCHDPHGVSAAQGNGVNNSHLINFDVSVVLPNTNGILMFEDRGTFSGACFVKCHNRNHDPSKGTGDY
ncbi:MAG: cytochrome c3 family protein [Acidobacteriota bacterium]